jgi:Fe-S cluster assembly ATP-binding protein
MLKIQDLQVQVAQKAILRGIDLTVKPGEVHAIMGPNGSGKSTLANVLAGREGYDVTSGTVQFQEQDLLTMDPEARAALGVFLAFQYPVEIPGVNNLYFLKAALNSMRKQRGQAALDAFDVTKLVNQKIGAIGMDKAFLKRSLNVGFSGGEKKRNEVLQMLLLEPSLAILDETDSGLDIDALQTVAKGVNTLRDGKRSFIVVTHYQRLLDYIVPDVVHVLWQGKIIRSGGPELAHKLEQKGYGWLTDQASVA